MAEMKTCEDLSDTDINPKEMAEGHINKNKQTKNNHQTTYENKRTHQKYMTKRHHLRCRKKAPKQEPNEKKHHQETHWKKILFF